ncbi:MAG: hypothetical protein Q7U66_03645 [Methylobacter sp.]|nr:hypothetical protein [Methylobacter sp.]
MNKVTPEQLLAEVDDVLRSMPTAYAFTSGNPEIYAWAGRASAVAHEWDAVKATIKFDPAISKLNSKLQPYIAQDISQALTFLHQVRHDLCMRT